MQTSRGLDNRTSYPLTRFIMADLIQLPDYNIVFDSIQSSLPAFLDRHNYSKIGILVDQNTRENCLGRVQNLLSEYHLIQISAGEINKSLDTCTNIWSSMADAGMDRHSLLINLGGGVIGDMGGFAASCYMRGIAFIQVPTTLLSQVDASVGGKLGIDFKGLKNFIGLFRNPGTVLINTRFLATLPEEELRSGYAEMLKHGLIRSNEIWHDLTANGDWKDAISESLIARSVSIKKEVVESDPFEGGLRKILNFGHTVGHAVESLALNTDQPLLHGEAIALGMMVEGMLSVSHCGLLPPQQERIVAYLSEVYDDLDLDILLRHDEILSIAASDKKNKDGRLLFALLEDIGKATFDIPVSSDDIAKALRQVYDQLVDN